MKIIVAGSRTITDFQLVKLQLEEMCSLEDEIVSGCAKGVDSLAIQFAEYWKMKLTKMPADWKTYGKLAGFIRNEAMAEYGDRLVAFWNGTSRGTRHMIKVMRYLGKPVDIFLPIGVDPDSSTEFAVTTEWIRREL